jgi:hypothetical protein
LFVGDRTSYTRISLLSFLGQSRRDGLMDGCLLYNSSVVRLSVSSARKRYLPLILFEKLPWHVLANPKGRRILQRGCAALHHFINVPCSSVDGGTLGSFMLKCTISGSLFHPSLFNALQCRLSKLRSVLFFSELR